MEALRWINIPYHVLYIKSIYSLVTLCHMVGLYTYIHVCILFVYYAERYIYIHMQQYKIKVLS